MTNREKVLARYPGAFCEHDLADTSSPSCKWYVYPSMQGRSLASGRSEGATWASAAKRIEQEQKK